MCSVQRGNEIGKGASGADLAERTERAITGKVDLGEYD